MINWQSSEIKWHSSGLTAYLKYITWFRACSILLTRSNIQKSFIVSQPAIYRNQEFCLFPLLFKHWLFLEKNLKNTANISSKILVSTKFLWTCRTLFKDSVLLLKGDLLRQRFYFLALLSFPGQWKTLEGILLLATILFEEQSILGAYPRTHKSYKLEMNSTKRDRHEENTQQKYPFSL